MEAETVQTSLAAVFGAETEPTAQETAPEVAETVETSAATAQATETPKTEQKAEPETPEVEGEGVDAAAEDDNDHPIPRKAHVAERNNWKAKVDDRDRELAELRGRLSVYQQQQQPPQGEQPDTPQTYWDEPESFTVNGFAQIRDEIFAARIDSGADALRTVHDDYDDAANIFLEAVRTDPVLAQGVRSAPSPARFIYEKGKALLEFQGMGSLEEWKAKVEAEALEKARAELSKSQAVGSAAQVTTSAASAGGKTTTEQPFAPSSLQDIFAGG